MAPRESVLHHIAACILAGAGRSFRRVGVDGVDGAGKTVFADELAKVLRAQGAAVVRASVDGFHNPRAVRYRQGRDSPTGYVEDSYDYATMRRVLLEPFGPRGTGRHRTAVFDHVADAAVDGAEQQAPPGAILLVDGIFLHRAELAACWGVSIFLDVAFATSFSRMAARDGSDPDPDAAPNRRYRDGQRLYLAACDPAARATWVIDNNDLAAPRIVRGPAG